MLLDLWHLLITLLLHLLKLKAQDTIVCGVGAATCFFFLLSQSISFPCALITPYTSTLTPPLASTNPECDIQTQPPRTSCL